MPRAEPAPPIEGVEVRETGRGTFQVEVRTAAGRFLADEPAAAGGLGSGATPYDLLGAALGACTAMTLRLYADRKAWPLKSTLVRVAHRSGGLEVKDRFAREIVLEGELSPEQRRRLLEIAERCPVHKTLARGSEMVSVLAESREPCELEPEPLDHASDMLELVEDY
ncbi:MAG TPA: OsmC family protein [Phenylobacterium sp.]|uniref:OsmC family protein n=1 Tax=Phenylobacterium sp. TaxID=1871053 RepID=UPI002D0EB2D6|nr:OsmC family protein [Phenylobacterium sp.]HSV02457.1 OsmC family protein [Phenylobacterium sp.]